MLRCSGVFRFRADRQIITIIILVFLKTEFSTGNLVAKKTELFFFISLEVSSIMKEGESGNGFFCYFVEISLKISVDA